MPKDKSRYMITYNKRCNLYEVIDVTLRYFPTVWVNESKEECEKCKSYLDKIDRYRSDLYEI